MNDNNNYEYYLLETTMFSCIKHFEWNCPKWNVLWQFNEFSLNSQFNVGPISIHSSNVNEFQNRWCNKNNILHRMSVESIAVCTCNLFNVAYIYQWYLLPRKLFVYVWVFGFYLNIVCSYRFWISKLNSENVLLIVWYTCSNIKQPNIQTTDTILQLLFGIITAFTIILHFTFYILFFVKFSGIFIWCIRTLYSKKNTDNYW